MSGTSHNRLNDRWITDFTYVVFQIGEFQAENWENWSLIIQKSRTRNYDEYNKYIHYAIVVT